MSRMRPNRSATSGEPTSGGVLRNINHVEFRGRASSCFSRSNVKAGVELRDRASPSSRRSCCTSSRRVGATLVEELVENVVLLCGQPRASVDGVDKTPCSHKHKQPAWARMDPIFCSVATAPGRGPMVPVQMITSTQHAPRARISSWALRPAEAISPSWALPSRPSNLTRRAASRGSRSSWRAAVLVVFAGAQDLDGLNEIHLTCD